MPQTQSTTLSSTSSTISPWPLVRRGDKVFPVRPLQQLLRARSHPVAVDGIFGPLTESAVKAFQQSKGLAPDGIVGPNTWPKLIVQVGPVTWRALVSGMLSG